MISNKGKIKVSKNVIAELLKKQEFMDEILAEYKCDYGELILCVSKILTITDNPEITELIKYTLFHLCANMK